MFRGLTPTLLFSILTFVVAACGSDASNEDGRPEDGRGASSGGPGAGGSSGGPETSGDPNVIGLWEVSGTDARGAYVGEIEIRHEAGNYRFVRAVRYPTVK